MNLVQLSRCTPARLRAVLLYEAGFTLEEIGAFEGTSRQAIHDRLSYVGIAARPSGPPPGERREGHTYTWQIALLKRLVSWGLTATEAMRLLSLPKVPLGSHGGPATGHKDLWSLAATSLAWREAQRDILAAAVLGGADYRDLGHLLGTTAPAGNTYLWRLRHVYGYRLPDRRKGGVG